MIEADDEFHYDVTGSALKSGQIYTTNVSDTFTVTFPEPEPTVVVRDGDIFVDEKDEGIGARIKRLEKILGVTNRSPQLEEKYPDLQEIGDRMDKAIEDLNKAYVTTISSIAGTYEDFAEECKVMEKLESDNGDVK